MEQNNGINIDAQTEERTQIAIELERSEAFKREISKADPITAKQLIAAWKEVIVEQFMKAVSETEDLEELTVLDTQTALVIEVSTYQQGPLMSRRGISMETNDKTLPRRERAASGL